MNVMIHRFLTVGVLATWATVLCYLSFSGRLSSYLHPTFQPLATACGIALGILAILVLFSPREVMAGAGCEPGAPRSTISTLAFAFVLVIPLLVTLAFSKGEFSASTVLNRGYVESLENVVAPVVEPAAESVPRDETVVGAPLPGENGEVDYGLVEEMPPPEIIDLLYAAQLPEMRDGLEGEEFEFIGQYMPLTDGPSQGNRFRLVRMMVVCCAADAQPVAVTVEANQSPKFAEMSWIKVRGIPSFPMVDGQTRPLLKATSVEKTDPPEDVFLY